MSFDFFYYAPKTPQQGHEKTFSSPTLVFQNYAANCKQILHNAKNRHAYNKSKMKQILKIFYTC